MILNLHFAIFLYFSLSLILQNSNRENDERCSYRVHLKLTYFGTIIPKKKNQYIQLKMEY